MGRIPALVVAILAVATPARADEVAGVVVDNANVAIPHIVVRVIGERFLVMAQTDDWGHFRVSGLPSGTYRVVVERGTVRPAPPPSPRPMLIDRDYIRCCACAMARARTFEATLGSPSVPAGERRSTPGRGHVDTRSTAQGIVIGSPGR